MDVQLSGNALALMVAALAAAGLLTGFLSGLLGVGGGGILVPVLYEAFSWLGVDPSVRMHLTLGTSLAVIVPTSLRSFAAHSARGAVDAPALWRLGPWMVAGVGVGILALAVSNSTALKLIWVVCGTGLCLKMALGRDDWRLAPELPKAPWSELLTVAIGAISTLMSIGGGAFMVTLLSLYGRPLLRAIATSSGFGPLIAIPGVLGYVWAGWDVPLRPDFCIGYVHLVAALVLIPACLVAVTWGVRLAHGLPKRRLEIAFAVFLALVVARFALSLVG